LGRGLGWGTPEVPASPEHSVKTRSQFVKNIAHRPCRGVGVGVSFTVWMQHLWFLRFGTYSSIL